MLESDTSINIYSKKDPFIVNEIKLFLVNEPIFCIAALLVILINYKTDNNIYIAIFTFYYVTGWSYFTHLLYHQPWFSLIGQIHLFHHNPIYHDSSIVFIIEALLDFFVFGGFILIFFGIQLEKFLGFKIFNHYIILFWALFYTSYHLLNYHYIKPDAHKQHHITNGINNYGPEWFDILFHTKTDNTEFENLNSGIPNLIVIAIIILALKGTPYDLTKYK